MDKRKLKKALADKTGCSIQYNGWPCGTCFFAMNDTLTNEDWQTLLFYRGDYKREELSNLPDNIKPSLNKIYAIAKTEGK